MPIAAILKVRMAASTYRGAYRARMSRFIGKIWDETVAGRGVYPRWALSPAGATASFLSVGGGGVHAAFDDEVVGGRGVTVDGGEGLLVVLVEEVLLAELNELVVQPVE